MMTALKDNPFVGQAEQRSNLHLWGIATGMAKKTPAQEQFWAHEHGLRR
jgi:hypothetical protein